MSELLLRAFQALGSSPTRREIALVAKALRESGDEETLTMFPEERGFDGLGAVTAMAERADAGAFVGLDLCTEVIWPGWSPFPGPRADKVAADADLAGGPDR